MIKLVPSIKLIFISLTVESEKGKTDPELEKFYKDQETTTPKKEEWTKLWNLSVIIIFKNNCKLQNQRD